MNKKRIAAMALAAVMLTGCGGGGGGSDANVMALHGIKAVVLSTGMAKVHTTSETITIGNLNKCAELVLDLMTH